MSQPRVDIYIQAFGLLRPALNHRKDDVLIRLRTEGLPNLTAELGAVSPAKGSVISKLKVKSDGRTITCGCRFRYGSGRAEDRTVPVGADDPRRLSYQQVDNAIVKQLRAHSDCQDAEDGFFASIKEMRLPRVSMCPT